MVQLRVASPQEGLVIHVMDADAPIFLKQPSWDTCLVERTLILSPGRGSQRGTRCCLHWEHMPGQMHAISFKGSRVEEIPYFGIVDLEGRKEANDTLHIPLPEAHRLPWIRPWRPRSWSQEEILEMILQRVRSALAAGHRTREVLGVIGIPDCVRGSMLPATWGQLIGTVRQMEPA